MAGAGTGVVEADELLGPERVRAGDVVVAMALLGAALQRLLARPARAARPRPGCALDLHVAELGRTLGEELLEPTRIYALDCLALARAARPTLHAFAHVTGGGLAANLARVLPAGVRPRVDRAHLGPAAGLRAGRRLGGVAGAELERTFNMGVGMGPSSPRRRRPGGGPAGGPRGRRLGRAGPCERADDAASAGAVALEGGRTLRG